jgi:hypothetical protein
MPSFSCNNENEFGKTCTKMDKSKKIKHFIGASPDA